MNAQAHDYFVQEAEWVLSQIPSVRSSVRVPEHFAIDVTLHNGDTHRVFLSNHFNETREMPPEERQRLLAFRFAAIEKRYDSSWPVDRDQLMPVIRRSMFGVLSAAEVPFNSTIEETRLLRRPFLPFVDVCVAIDRPESMEMVTASTLRDWGVGEEDVFAAAFARVPLLGGPHSLRLLDNTYGPLWVVSANDSYEASRLLIPGWLASFGPHVHGRPIAIVPQREIVMVGGDYDPRMVERLLSSAEAEFGASGRAISCAIYTVDDHQRVVPYFPAPHSPLATVVRVAHEKLALSEYEEQKRFLQRERSEFIAAYAAFQNPAGGVRTQSSWAMGVPTLLPRTSHVSLVPLGEDGSGAENAIVVPFEAIVDRLTTVPNVHPPRYATGSFPTPAEFQALRSQLVQ